MRFVSSRLLKKKTTSFPQHFIKIEWKYRFPFFLFYLGSLFFNIVPFNFFNGKYIAKDFSNLFYFVECFEKVSEVSIHKASTEISLDSLQNIPSALPFKNHQYDLICNDDSPWRRMLQHINIDVPLPSSYNIPVQSIYDVSGRLEVYDDLFKLGLMYFEDGDLEHAYQIFLLLYNRIDMDLNGCGNKQFEQKNSFGNRENFQNEDTRIDISPLQYMHDSYQVNNITMFHLIDRDLWIREEKINLLDRIYAYMSDAALNLATMLHLLGRYDEANIAYESLYDIKWKSIVSLSPQVSESSIKEERKMNQIESEHEESQYEIVYPFLTNSRVLNNHGALLLISGKDEDAKEKLYEALSHDSSCIDCMINLVTYYREEGLISTAEQFLLQAYELTNLNVDDNANINKSGSLNSNHSQVMVEKINEKIDFSAVEIKSITARSGLLIFAAIALPPIMHSENDILSSRRNFLVKVRQVSDLFRKAYKDGIISIHQKNYKPVKDIERVHFYLPYHGHGYDDRLLQESLMNLYLLAQPDLAYISSSCLKTESFKRKRIGFISKFFGPEEPHGLLLKGPIALLPRDRFEVILISIPSPSSYGYIDDHLLKAADHVVKLPLDGEFAKTTLSELQLDVLIYADMNSEPMTHFLGFARFAPVQVLFWGNPITSGKLNSIDYFISADIMEDRHKIRNNISLDLNLVHVEKAESYPDPYTEQVVLLGGQGIWYDKPTPYQLEEDGYLPYQPSPKSKSANHERSNYGFSPRWTLYMCLQSTFKLHPSFDEVLFHIIHYHNHLHISRIDNSSFSKESRGEEGHIVLLQGRKKRWTDATKARILSSFRNEILKMNETNPGSFGTNFDIEKVLEIYLSYIHFLPRVSAGDGYRTLLEMGDVFLQPFPFGGSRTSAEVLDLGKVLVTFPQEHLRGRMAYTFFHTMGMTPQQVLSGNTKQFKEIDTTGNFNETELLLSCVAFSSLEYVEKAVRLGLDTSFRHLVSRIIQQRSHLLWERREVVLEWTDFLLTATDHASGPLTMDERNKILNAPLPYYDCSSSHDAASGCAFRDITISDSEKGMIPLKREYEGSVFTVGNPSYQGVNNIVVFDEISLKKSKEAKESPHENFIAIVKEDEKGGLPSLATRKQIHITKPTSDDVFFEVSNLVQYALRMRNLGEEMIAYSLLRRAHQLQPTNYGVLVDLGSLCQELWRFEEAEHYFKLALTRFRSYEIDPRAQSNPISPKCKAYEVEVENIASGSDELKDVCMSIDPNIIYNNLAVLYQSRELYSEAEKYYQKIFCPSVKNSAISYKSKDGYVNWHQKLHSPAMNFANLYRDMNQNQKAIDFLYYYLDLNSIFVLEREGVDYSGRPSLNGETIKDNHPQKVYGAYEMMSFCELDRNIHEKDVQNHPLMTTIGLQAILSVLWFSLFTPTEHIVNAIESFIVDFNNFVNADVESRKVNFNGKSDKNQVEIGYPYRYLEKGLTFDLISRLRKSEDLLLLSNDLSFFLMQPETKHQDVARISATYTPLIKQAFLDYIQPPLPLFGSFLFNNYNYNNPTYFESEKFDVDENQGDKSNNDNSDALNFIEGVHGVHIITEYYLIPSSPKRQLELNIALCMNLLNPFVEGVHLLYQEENFLPSSTPEVKGRSSFGSKNKTISAGENIATRQSRGIQQLYDSLPSWIPNQEKIKFHSLETVRKRYKAENECQYNEVESNENHRMDTIAYKNRREEDRGRHGQVSEKKMERATFGDALKLAVSGRRRCSGYSDVDLYHEIVMIMNADIFTDATISRLLLASPYVYNDDNDVLQEQGDDTSPGNSHAKSYKDKNDAHLERQRVKDIFLKQVFALAKWDVNSFHVDMLENILTKLKRTYKGHNEIDRNRNAPLSLEHFYLIHNINYPFSDKVKKRFNWYVGGFSEQSNSTTSQENNDINTPLSLYSSTPTLRVDSQDAWVFKPIYLDDVNYISVPPSKTDLDKNVKSNPPPETENNSSFSTLNKMIEMTDSIEFGRPRCDNRLAYLFQDVTKAKVTSPSLGLITHHLHQRASLFEAETNYMEGYSMKVGEKVPGKGASVPLSNQYLF